MLSESYCVKSTVVHNFIIVVALTERQCFL
jgi:hypothetical protein